MKCCDTDVEMYAGYRDPALPDIEVSSISGQLCHDQLYHRQLTMVSATGYTDGYAY